MQIAGTSLKPLEVWRGDVELSETRNFASSLAVSLIRAGAGARVTAVGPRPSDTLILFEMENCPFSRLVREALSELDLDAVIKPCPRGEKLHRAELFQLTGKETVPYLIDRGMHVALHDSPRIVRHLHEHYGAGKVPARLRGGELTLWSSKLASRLRGGEQGARTPAQRPAFPLELWNYEGSPYCRLVREALERYGLSYVSHNLARQSPRRGEFLERFGKPQFPCLFDPNLNLTLFESSAIADHVERVYGRGEPRQTAA